MKLTLLDPCDYNTLDVYKTIAPLGLGYIAGYLDHYFDNQIDVSIEIDPAHILKHKPDIVGISAYTQNYNKAIEVAKMIKREANIPVIVGGKHITALPNNLHDAFDVGIVGDGEITTAKLIESYMNNGRFLPEELANIQGIVFKDNKDFHVTQQRPAFRDLDELPKPNRKVLHAYWPTMKKEWFWPQPLFTSRGCPYKCPFCIHSKLKFVSRFHSPERVVEEILEIINTNPDQKFISIYDDLFVFRKDRLKAIVDLIVSEKIHKKVFFASMCKSNHFDEEIAYQLRRMNVRQVSFGLESGDEEVLQFLKKDSSTVDQNLQALNLCEKYGIIPGGYFITGSPMETKKALNNTYWFIRQNFPPMGMLGAYSLTPFPGTKAWDIAKEKELVSEDSLDWDTFNFLTSENSAKFFMNENYDYEFFNKVYKEYFLTLYEKHKIYKTNEKMEFEIIYYDLIFKIMEKLEIEVGENTLEISSNYVKSLAQINEEEMQVTNFDHWIYKSNKKSIASYEEKTIKDKKFDMIVFNHSLEQIRKPIEKMENFIKNNLADSGKVLILIRNKTDLLDLHNLLYCMINNNSAGFKPYDDYFKVEFKTIVTNLNLLGLKIKNLIPLPVGMKELTEISKPVLEVLKKHINIEQFINSSKIHSYFIYAEK